MEMKTAEKIHTQPQLSCQGDLNTSFMEGKNLSESGGQNHSPKNKSEKLHVANAVAESYQSGSEGVDNIDKTISTNFSQFFPKSDAFDLSNKKYFGRKGKDALILKNLAGDDLI